MKKGTGGSKPKDQPRKKSVEPKAGKRTSTATPPPKGPASGRPDSFSKPMYMNKSLRGISRRPSK